ncbi:MAG: N-acetyl-alpha-D-glucosaminyl L-malate synthase BshA [Terriglobales bacterium]
MRIGVTCYPTYGGSGIVATELGRELAERGHEIHFISYAQPIRLDTDQPRIFYHEVEVSTYPLFDYPPYTLALASHMAEVAESAELDLLHVHYAIPHSVSAFLARAMTAARRLPFITTLHGTDITLVGADHSYLPITRFAIEASDGVTAISEYLRQTTATEFEVRRPIEVIPNFVNCDRYHRQVIPELRARYAPEAEPLLVHLSNFRPVKRVLDVVEIFARVAARRPARLLMIGDGPDRGQAERRARCLGVGERVSFVGKQDAIHELLSISDLMLLPSAMESFGLAALEGMAHEVPAVASRVGGVPEVVEDGVTGRLLPAGDIEGMAEAAIALLAEPERLRAMGRASRRLAEERFCASRIIPQYEDLYARVVSGNHAAARPSR